MNDDTRPSSILDQIIDAFQQGMRESQGRHDRKKEGKRRARAILLEQQESKLLTMLRNLNDDQRPESEAREELATELEVWMELYRETQRL